MPQNSPFIACFIGPRGLRAGWRAALFIVLTALLAAAIYLLLFLLKVHAAGPRGVITPAMALLNEGILLPAALAAAWIMSRLENRRWLDYAAPVHRRMGRNFLVGVLWGLAAMSALLGLMRWAGVYDFGSLAIHGSALWRYALIWAAAFLLVSGFEEFSFRGYLLYTFATGIGFWPAAILSSLFFGAMHLGNRGEDILGALSAGLAGLFFAFTVRRTGNLGWALGFHAAWDYAESYIYGVPDSGARSLGALLAPHAQGSVWLTGGSVGPEGSLIVFFILGILFLLFGRLYPQTLYPGLRPVSLTPQIESAGNA